MSVAEARVSYAELERWPEDGRRYELYNGEVSVVPSPLPVHQIVLANLHLALSAYVRTYGGLVLFAPLDIVLTDYDVVQPDLVLFTRERQALVHLRRVTRHPPDLAIEILSPSTVASDRGRKMALLASHGVQEYWIVDPDAIRIEVYWLSGEQFLVAAVATAAEPVQSPLLPELRLTPNDVIPDSAGFR